MVMCQSLLGAQVCSDRQHCSTTWTFSRPTLEVVRWCNAGDTDIVCVTAGDRIATICGCPCTTACHTSLLHWGIMLVSQAQSDEGTELFSIKPHGYLNPVFTPSIEGSHLWQTHQLAFSSMLCLCCFCRLQPLSPPAASKAEPVLLVSTSPSRTKTSDKDLWCN